MVSLNFISAQLRGHKLFLTEGSTPQTVWQHQLSQSAIPLLERNTVSKLGKSVKDSRSETQSRNLESGAGAEAMEGQILTGSPDGLLSLLLSRTQNHQPRADTAQ